MKQTLDQLAEVRSGVTLRGTDASRPVPGGAFPFIRISDLSPEGFIKPDDIITIAQPPDLQKDHILQPGDVIFACRGTRLQAAAFTLPLSNALVGSQFFIIRPRNKEILPEYLAWAINSPECQKQLSAQATGSYIQLIPSLALRNLQIPLVPYPMQVKLMEIHRLSLHEQSLSHELAHKRRLLVQTAIQRLTTTTARIL
jgi:restriction endonuclease S subunit